MRYAGPRFIGVILPCALLAMGLATPNPLAAIRKSESLRCTAITSGDIILMRARFEVKIADKAFAVNFEAEPEFGADRSLTVLVVGVPVGELKSQQIVGGYVGGEMSFSDPADPIAHSEEFPDNFPSVLTPDTTISLASGGKTLVSCRLE